MLYNKLDEGFIKEYIEGAMKSFEREKYMGVDKNDPLYVLISEIIHEHVSSMQEDELKEKLVISIFANFTTGAKLSSNRLESTAREFEMFQILRRIIKGLF